MRVPYEFKAEDAERFAHQMGIRAYQKGDQLHFKTCPYCHGIGKQNEKSFAIDLETGKFNCFRSGCGAKGNMLTLAKDFDFDLGFQISEYVKPKKKYKQLTTPAEPIVPKPEAIKYLLERGISEDVAKKYQITVQTDHHNVLVFPFYDEKNTLQFIKYRKTDFNKETDHAKEWAEKDCKPILFGMAQCDMNCKRLIFNEGQIDTLSVAECGISNAVSVPTGNKGFTWIPYCWDWIHKFNEIIIFGDHEKGKITLLDEIKQRFSQIKIKHVREEDYKDCKDANEILLKYGKEQIVKCVENAVELPINKVIDLSEVEDVDIFKINKLKTGFKEVDRILFGGLPFGGVSIISGKRGQGKSALSSQLLAEALSQGYKCFAYSGELPNHLFKAWMDFQIAGRKYVFEAQSHAFGNVTYSISKTNKQLISSWYKGKMYLYDNSSFEGEEKESLVKTVEEVIIRYGVSVILIDNLMTGIDLESCEGSDKYEKQSQFVKKLSRIAMKWNVLIILVAHKRKNSFSKDENDEISGSGDISNIAMVTLSYEKDKDIDENNRLLKISKSRLHGIVNEAGFEMRFEPRSRRIYGENDDVDKNYGWNNAIEFEFIDEETPFG